MHGKPELGIYILKVWLLHAKLLPFGSLLKTEISF
jgi:hypothetical protein